MPEANWFRKKRIIGSVVSGEIPRSDSRIVATIFAILSDGDNHERKLECQNIIPQYSKYRYEKRA